MLGHEPVDILLVDDQPAKLLSYEVILGELGENLVKANSAREALEILLKRNIAVILVDVCMPELDGFEFAKLLRNHPRYEQTAIIFISAIQISEIDHVRGYETGAVDYVSVPVVPAILRAKVRIFAELWRKTRQLERLNNELEQRVRERTAELEQSASQLHEASERLRLAGEAAGFGTYEYNIAAGRLYWSPSLREMIGVPHNEPLTLESALEPIHPDHRDMLRRHIDGYAPEHGRRELEFMVVRPDGEVRWLLDRGQAIDTGENGVRVMGTVLDITERKRSEERQHLLMAELDHRVKNILSHVSAVARLSSQRAKSVTAFVDALDGRIQAISRAHGLLRRHSWSGASLAELVDDALSPFRSKTNMDIAGIDLIVAPDIAQSLALILHELATNAVKHGALSSPEGRLSLSWRRSELPKIRLDWKEEGGPRPSPPVTNGFGLNLLQAAANDLGAASECRFTHEGFCYSLEGPLELRQNTGGDMSTTSDSVTYEIADGSVSNGMDNGYRILVVEDEFLVALQLQDDLERAGYSVIGPARSVQQALHLTSQEKFDAALVDFRLGSETSESVANQLIEMGIPFAFATGYVDSSVLPSHLRTIPKLDKPYLIQQVREVLDQLMGQERTPAENASIQLSE